MEFRKNQKGFTLVEVMLVIAIIAVVASLAFSMLGRLKYADTEKMVTYVSDAIAKLQATSLSRENARYLHIYKESNGYYMIVSTSPTYNASTMGSNGTYLGNSIKIYKLVKGAADKVEIKDNTRIVLSYKKNGQFRTQYEVSSESGPSTMVDMEIIKSITIEGNYTAVIKLNEKTGKQFLENE